MLQLATQTPGFTTMHPEKLAHSVSSVMSSQLRRHDPPAIVQRGFAAHSMAIEKGYDSHSLHPRADDPTRSLRQKQRCRMNGAPHCVVVMPPYIEQSGTHPPFTTMQRPGAQLLPAASSLGKRIRGWRCSRSTTAYT